MFETIYECPNQIKMEHKNFVLRVERENESRWFAVLPYFEPIEAVHVGISERIADVIMSNWKQGVPVYLEFRSGFRNGNIIETYHYSLRVCKLFLTEKRSR